MQLARGALALVVLVTIAVGAPGTLHGKVFGETPIAAAAWTIPSCRSGSSGFDATHAAATAALSADARVRHALAEALACPFPLVGDDFVIDQLARDPEREVRAAASHAARVRRLG